MAKSGTLTFYVGDQDRANAMREGLNEMGARLGFGQRRGSGYELIQAILDGRARVVALKAEDRAWVAGKLRTLAETEPDGPGRRLLEQVAADLDNPSAG